jgi:hypothetical protein
MFIKKENVSRAESENNPVFSIPAAGSTTNTDAIVIGSKNVQGHITGIVQAKVTIDATGQNNQLGKVFTKTFELTSFFCERPWPSVENYPYTDKQYNYQMGYYAKARSEQFPKLLDILSDLYLNPLLETAEIEKEKGVISDELNMYEDLPMRRVGEYSIL